MLYWLTRTAGSSARLYYERAHTTYDSVQRSLVPTAVADFPAENQIPLRHKAEQANNIIRWTSFKHGGHFAAMEQPRCTRERHSRVLPHPALTTTRMSSRSSRRARRRGQPNVQR